ncbi:phosphoglycerate mutase [Colletotrichum graminicola M1.001]|uniref:Phosphoglycerate mutase n=1 Tax=Colletotrichum graminicola (strain M1.001 / M2 / FGSC 10212) TaxID=645133 RepID=E3QZM9_COLGM|nr:phosphoglycerate mutase [Colletotrichum graminicola M1.001]EFQ36317.1 phosphoglycerate mutase [Colletotrichum graminicola M1.001]
MGAVHLYLVRHGESVDNVANLFAGSRDAPLTSHGVLQARRLGAHLATRTASASASITHIFASNLQRAHRTAAAVRDAVDSHPSASSSRVGAIEVVQLPELREKHFGTGEGQKFGARMGSGPDRPRHEGAEDQGAMRMRAERFVEDYLAPIFACMEAESGDGAESIVIVAHGIILGVLARVLCTVGSFAAVGPVTKDRIHFSWSNTGYVEMHITTTPVSSASKQAVPTVKWPGLALKTVAVNCTDHLRGLKKTGGGIGSAEFDEKQKTLRLFFAPTSKKRKHDEA